MKENKIIVAGIGPGSPEDITPAVVNALKDSDVVIGYKYYFQFITSAVGTDRMHRYRNEAGESPCRIGF